MRKQLPQWFAPALDDRRQRLRLRRFVMSLASYTMWYLIALASWHAGLLDISGESLALAGVLMFMSQAVFHVLIRSGANLRFADPSLTVPQILVGLAWSLFLIAISREIRGVMLTAYMITLLFGIFALDRRRFLLVGLAAYVGYATLVVYERISGLAFFSAGYYVLSLIVLGGILLWTASFGSYVSDLRHKLQARNEELETVLAKMRDLADRDDLTGLLNRRVIMENLQRLEARAERTGETFSVCIIDLDKFKLVNDQFGHLAGDRVLVAFSETMSRELRGMDFAARSSVSLGRYGGEEFILLLPNTDAGGAQRCAERLREQQEAWRATDTELPPYTFSAGVAEYRTGENVESLLRRADHALYAAKHAGRNRVELARNG